MNLKRSFTLAAAVACATLSSPSRADFFGFDFVDAQDLDGDGIHDIVGDEFAAGQDARLFAIDSVTGSVLWDTPVLHGAGFFFKKALATVDSIDGDATPDIAYQELGSSVSLFSGANGDTIDTIAIRALNPADPNKFVVAAAQLPADLTGDGIRELVVGSVKAGGGCPGGKTDSGFVYAIDPLDPGKPLWISKGPAGSYNFGWDITPLAHDYDADGAGDLLVTDNCRPKSVGANLFTKGAAYIVSSRNGAILKEFFNPTIQPNPEFEGNILFGFDALETQDLDHDGIRDFFISEVNVDAISGGETAVDLVSGKDGSVLCRHVSPNQGFDGFGSSLGGGKFKLGDPANGVYNFYNPPHDVLVGAPDVGKAYVLRIDPMHCDTKPVKEFGGAGALGNRVGILAPPYADPGKPGGGYNDLLIDAPLDGNGVLHRYSGKDGILGQGYMP